MCAIAGMIDLKPMGIEDMLHTMERRGPDGEGVWQDAHACLLHRRLAIMDPEHGAQPMVLSQGGRTYVLVYNGELYNTEEIRRELTDFGHSFHTNCDTEVVLHACLQWGADALQKLNGIFAFGFWSSESRSLLLARDPMGVKPLFYSLHRGGILFASEIKTLLAYPTMDARLEENGVAQLLLMGPGRIPGSGVLKDIYELKPGEYGIYEKGSLRKQTYWRLRDREHTESFEETVEHTRFLVTDAIRRQTVSHVPIGTFLSGGLDSSLISSIVGRKYREEGKRLPTFSVDYEDNSLYFQSNKFQPTADGDYIRIMQDYLGCEPNDTLLAPEELAQTLEEATIARDLPGMADVDFSLLAFCKRIRKRVKVALSGECADEIFGGYPWYRDPEVRARAGFPWAQNTKYRMGFLHPDYRLDGEAYVMEQYEQTVRSSDILPGTSPEERRIKEMVNLNQQWFMQTLLDRKDRMSMYCGLEVRVPFCDYRIAEYLYGVPWQWKDYGGCEKGLLRHAAKGLLPEAVLWRKKSPYPKTYHPRYLQLMAHRLDALLGDTGAPVFQIVDRKALMQLKDDRQPWPWYGQLMKTPQTIAYMLQLDFWLRHYKVTVL